MKSLQLIFGQGEQLTVLQMSARAVVLFFVTLLLIRLGGVRIFGKKSSFDTIIMIVMGALLGRGIVGASPFLSIIGASASLIAAHRLVAWACIKNRMLEKLIKGKATLLYENQEIYEQNLMKTSLSKEDLLESLHLETNDASLDRVDKAYMETNGRISFILKKK